MISKKDKITVIAEINKSQFYLHTHINKRMFNTYRKDEHRKLRQASTSAKSRQSFHCSHTQEKDVDYGSG